MFSFRGPSLNHIVQGNRLWDEGKYAEALAEYEPFFQRENFEHAPPVDDNNPVSFDDNDTVGYALYNCMCYFLHQNKYDLASYYLNSVSERSKYQSLMIGTYLSRVHPSLQQATREYLFPMPDMRFVDALIYRANIHVFSNDQSRAIDDFNSAYEQTRANDNWKTLYVLSKLIELKGAPDQSKPDEKAKLAEHESEKKRLIELLSQNIEKVSLNDLCALLIADIENASAHAKRILVNHDVKYIPLYIEEDFLRVFKNNVQPLESSGSGIPFFQSSYKHLPDAKDLFSRIISSCKNTELQMEALDAILDGDASEIFLTQMFHEQRYPLNQPSTSNGRLQPLHELREQIRTRTQRAQAVAPARQEDSLDEQIKLNPLYADLYYMRSRKFHRDLELIPLNFHLNPTRTRSDKAEALDDMLLNARKAVHLNPISAVFRKWLASVCYLQSLQEKLSDDKFNELQARAVKILNTGIRLGLEIDDYLQSTIDRIYVESAKMHFNNLGKLSPGPRYSYYCRQELAKITSICESIKTPKAKAHAYYVLARSLQYPTRDLEGQVQALETALVNRPNEPVLHYARACIDIFYGRLNEAKSRLAAVSYDEAKFAETVTNFLKKRSHIALAISYTGHTSKKIFSNFLLESEFNTIRDIELNDFYHAMSMVGNTENDLLILLKDNLNKVNLFANIEKISNPQVKIETLIQSLSKHALLGQYFHIKRYSKPPSVKTGSLKKVVNLLQQTLDEFPEYVMSKHTKEVLDADQELMAKLSENYAHLYTKLVSLGKLRVAQLPGLRTAKDQDSAFVREVHGL